MNSLNIPLFVFLGFSRKGHVLYYYARKKRPKMITVRLELCKLCFSRISSFLCISSQDKKFIFIIIPAQIFISVTECIDSHLR